MPEFDKDLDLHPSEWREAEKPEPILGPNGAHFLIMFALSFPAYWFSSTVVELVVSFLP